MAPKAKRREGQNAITNTSRTRSGAVAAACALERGAEGSTDAPAPTSTSALGLKQPPRILVLRKKKPLERVAELAAAVPTVEPPAMEGVASSSGATQGTMAATAPRPTDPTLVGTTVGQPPLDAVSSVVQAAEMLRAVYVVTHTEKAQLKLRPHDLGSHHAAAMATSSATSIGSGTRFINSASSGAAASPQKVVQTGLSSGFGAFRSHPTPPPSPSRFFGHLSNGLDAASPPRSQQTMQRERDSPSGSGSEPSAASSLLLSVVVFADMRWRNAVSSFVGGEPFTLDHLARLPVLFPEHIRVSWTSGGAGATNSSQRMPFAPSMPSLLGSGRHVEDALRQLAEEQGTGDGWSVNTRPLASSGDGGYATGVGQLRARVTLLKVDVPSTTALVSELMGRNGVDLIHSLAFETAWSLLLKGSATAGGRASVSCCGSQPQPPSPPNFGAAGDLPATGARKRDRDDNSTADVTGIPEHLLAVLSNAKRDSIVQARSAQHKAEVNREAESLSLRHSLEKLLSVYDLTRICFGVGRTHIGGAKLLEVLTDQNRYGCDRAEIAMQVHRLLTFPESGLTTTSIEGEARDEEASASVSVSDEASARALAYEGRMFHLNPNACRASLETAIGKCTLQPVA